MIVFVDSFGKYFDGEIEELEPNQIFVFGSNTEGRHGLGAAKTARQKFGAKYGQSKGLQGRSYAIITKNLTVTKSMRSVPIEKIEEQIVEFLEFAAENPDLEFFVTEFGCKLAGYKVEEIAWLFKGKVIPANVVLNKRFHEVKHYHT